MPCPKLIDVASPGNETYCGIYSLVIGIFCFPCICFCPIDQKRETEYEY